MGCSRTLPSRCFPTTCNAMLNGRRRDFWPVRPRLQPESVILPDHFAAMVRSSEPSDTERGTKNASMVNELFNGRSALSLTVSIACALSGSMNAAWPSR